jgi:hypothetical protein
VPLAHRRIRWRIVVATAVVIVLGATGFVVIRYVFREHPGPKSLHAAVKAFQGMESTPAGSTTLRNDLPAEGVYPIKGQGTERISFPPNSQLDGAVMPVTIMYLADACWRWHIDYNVAHWEEYDFCPRRGGLLLAGSRVSQSWDFGDTKVNNLSRFTCPSVSVVLPQDPKPGQTQRYSCTGSNTAVSGRSIAATTVRIVGIVTLQIGGVVVPTIHELQQVTLTGGQRGRVREDWWFTVSSGLPVRVARQITLLSNSPIGTITYNEVGSWQMTSLRLQT